MAYGGRRNPREQARAWPQKAKVVLPEKRERGNEDDFDGCKGSGKENQRMTSETNNIDP